MVVAREDKHFDEAKRRVLAQLAACIDNSKKGDIDAPIADLIAKINASNDYVTTSSCSGRVALFVESSEQKKSSGTWLLASHEPVTGDDVSSALAPQHLPTQGLVVFKYEPFILHVQCRTLELATDLLRTALDVGLRNSGMVLGKKIMVAVRTTLKLEAPVALDGRLVVDDAYLSLLTKTSSGMFEENQRRIDRFEKAVDALFAKQLAAQVKMEEKRLKAERGRSMARTHRHKDSPCNSSSDEPQADIPTTHDEVNSSTLSTALWDES